MKYNIEINQFALTKTGLDVIDGAILDYLNVICSSKNKKVVGKRIDNMTWVDYTSLMEEMPMLRIKSKSAISRRIKRIERAGFIITKLIGHQKMYFDTTEKTEKLFFYSNRAVALKQRIIILDNINNNNRKTRSDSGFKNIKDIMKEKLPKSVSHTEEVR